MNPQFHDFLSDPKFKCLEHFDPTQLTSDEKAAIAACTHDVILEFLRVINHHHTTQPFDGRLRHDLSKWANDHLAQTGSFSLKFFNGIVDAACYVGECMYPAAAYGYETRLYMAMGSLAYFAIDDGSAKNQNVQSFHFDIWQQNEPASSWCAMYRQFIREWADHFGANDPRMGSLGAMGWANGVDAATVEQTLATRQHPHLDPKKRDGKPNGCCPRGFASSLRLVTGLPEPYAVAVFKPERDVEIPLEYWVTSMDHLKTFINHGNDLFSWPKEIMAAETFNFMTLQTLSMRQAGKLSTFNTEGDGLWTFRDTLCELWTALVESIVELDKAFISFADVCEEPLATEWKVDLASTLWKQYRMSFFSCHLVCPRYKLSGLIGRLETPNQMESVNQFETVDKMEAIDELEIVDKLEIVTPAPLISCQM